MPTATITTLFNTIARGVREDIRVRWGIGAGASVLLSAGVLGLGGSITPQFLHASAAPAASLPGFVRAEAEALTVVDMSTTTVAEIIESLPKAARYELLAYNAGLQDTLREAGVVTVFVPASAEFDYLPKRYIASLTRLEARRLALSHIVERAVPIQESLNGNLITAGDTLLSFTVDSEADTVVVGGANVLKVYKASNGYVYLIDKVLVQEAE
jgi:uncharacterized surface protein with fasciclin (FAS1) repeats